MSNEAQVENKSGRSLRFATAPVNWNNDDIPEWRPHVPFPDILDRMREAGYTATEYGANFPSSPYTLRRELTQRSLVLCGAYQWLPLRDHDQLSRQIDALELRLRLLQETACQHLIIADNMTPERVALAGQVPADGSRSLDRTHFQKMANGVALVAARVRPYGLRVHVHNHVGTYVETPWEVAALAAVMDPNHADFCFDTGHYAYGGGDPVTFVRENANRIGYMHLKDVARDVLTNARRERQSFLDALRRVIFCRIGEGIVDIPAILRSLQTSSFDGWIVVEQDTCDGDATASAAQNLIYLRHCVAVASS